MTATLDFPNSDEWAAGVWTERAAEAPGAKRPRRAAQGGKTPGTGPRTPSGARQSNTVPPESALGLFAQAENGLAAAELEDDPAQRFATAYLAALRAAAALLALRGRPHRARSRPMSVWTLLSSVAPELREWSAFFASCSATRASVQAGITRAVSTRSADDLTRQTGQFLELVARMIRGSRDQ